MSDLYEFLERFLDYSLIIYNKLKLQQSIKGENKKRYGTIKSVTSKNSK